MFVPYWRLSGFYGLYFALIGCIMPFWGLYLQQQSFAVEDIGILLALFSAVRIFAPNIWASTTHLCEKIIAPIQLMRIAGLLMFFCFMAIYWATEFWHYALIMVCYGFFWSALLPQYETLTLDYIKDDLNKYSGIRLWGSIGFILMVSLLGWAFDFISINYLPAIMLALMLGIVLNGFSLPALRESRKPVSINNELSNISNELSNTLIGPDVITFSDKSMRLGIISFILMTVLLQITHGPYYVFFSIYLQGLGYSNWAIGLLWSLGVLAEIIVFWRIAFFLRHWSLRELVVSCLILTSIRWFMTAHFSDNSFILIASQCLHAFSFGVLHAVSVKYIAIFFPGKKQLHGQALYSGLGFGLGGAIGAYLAGITWASQGPQFVFISAAVIALVASIIAVYGLPRENNFN
jgi:PPP family 3-phenylpropionic acid transporter